MKSTNDTGHVSAEHDMSGFCIVRKKLKSDDGASLMLALLFFLVCAVGGAVILASATASAGRVSSLQDKDRQQEEYAVDSAASLLKEELEKDTVYLKVQKTSPEFSNINNIPAASADGWTSVIAGICDADGNVKDEPDGFMEKFIFNRKKTGSVNYDSNDYLQNTAASSKTPVLEMAVKDDSKFPVVCAVPSLSGDSGETLTITLKKKDSGEEKDRYTNTITGKMQVETVSETVHITSPEERGKDDRQYQQVKTKIVRYSWTDLSVGK